MCAVARAAADAPRPPAQISLRNYDPNKDKRFSGTLRLPSTPRPQLKICMLGSEVDNKKAKEAGIDSLVRVAR